MRLLPQRESAATALIPPDFTAQRIERTSFFEFGIYLKSEEINFFACVNCPEKYCYQIHSTEFFEPQDSHVITPLCPADAVTFEESTVTIDYTKCIGCGLCSFRCPYACIKLDENCFPIVNSNNATYEKVSIYDFGVKASTIGLVSNIPNTELSSVINIIFGNLRNSTQKNFYPLVGSLLSIIGYKTLVTRGGDTNNRADAIIVSTTDSIPIEIKSPTESDSINVKSIQQAVENKVIFLSRKYFSTRRESTSLAIGYDYPAIRSDVDELISNIFNSFNINIGMIDIRTLYHLAIQKQISRKEPDYESINILKGRL